MPEIVKGESKKFNEDGVCDLGGWAVVLRVCFFLSEWQVRTMMVRKLIITALLINMDCR